jgi:6-phosphofructokinase 1
VTLAVDGNSGVMASIRRRPGADYRAFYDQIPLDVVANSHRGLPRHWLSDDQLDVTDDFIRYARPLIGEGWPEIELEGGLQRFARLTPVFVEKHLPEYVPEKHR